MCHASIQFAFRFLQIFRLEFPALNSSTIAVRLPKEVVMTIF